jgi:serine phosphatase RsbU (regulator of sigma subunit)
MSPLPRTSADSSSSENRGLPRFSFRTKLVIALAGLSFLTAAVVLHLAWRRGRENQLKNLRGLLEAVTSAVAPGIDGDAHAKLQATEATRAATLADPFFRSLRALGARVLASNERFQEVFTLGDLDGRGRGQARIYLSDEDGEVGKPYDTTRFPAMRRACETGACTSDDVLETDEYGTTISGYAPIRDHDGKTVGLFGIDVDVTTVEGMRRELLGILALGAVGAALFSGALGWFLASRISRPVTALSSAMDRVAGGDYTTRSTWTSGDEFGRLSTQFNRMVEGLDERQRLKHSLAVAMEIQQALLPAGPPTVAGVDIAGFSDYCDETGGDYFDYPKTWAVPGGRVALTVGDVTGHGIGAAILMSTGRAVLRSHAERDSSPGEILTFVNAHLAHDATSGKFMTLFYGVLDPAAGTLVYSNGGQGGCYVLRKAAGTFDEMPALAPPVGVVPGIPFPEGRVDGIGPGDVILLATDGVWETRDRAGEQFDFQRMEAVVRANAGRDAKAISDALRAAVEAFRADGPQEDDVTVIVAKLTGTALPSPSSTT